MMSSLHDAGEELKRVDHQIYVSLKYTRTVDVLVNIINRMIDAYDHLIDALLKHALAKNLVAEVPETPRERSVLVKSLFEDPIVSDNIALYGLLRDIKKASHQKVNEYRRHVTLITYLHGKEELVDIDTITNYYRLQREFFAFVERLAASP